MKRSIYAVLAMAIVIGGCGEDKPPLFEERPECTGDVISPGAGQHQQVISFLEIGTAEDGFDLDRDGEPDNKLAAVGQLARSAIEDSFENYELLIPIEFFDFGTPGPDECVKFALYVGRFRFDRDSDGDDTANDDADCNDHEPAIHHGAAEVAGNMVDDNCDGLADEADGGAPAVDNDADGVTMAAGDCDDTNPAINPGAIEICEDGLDNDCDGNGDFGQNASGGAACSPYDAELEELAIDPLSFDGDGNPVIQFLSGTVRDEGGVLKLEAGPSLFSVQIAVADGLNLDLRISGATIFGDIVMTGDGYSIENGRLGGVLDAQTMDQVRGLSVEEINLTEDNSLLDATYANILGTILALPRLPQDHEFAGCHTPDIDVDQDGTEAFCDSDPLDDVSAVDICIDGNGKVYRDEVDGSGNVLKQCSEMTDSKGAPLFTDGISVEINFRTTPAQLPASLP